jgi:ABC-type transport system involved in multi-copper enzyme maturation permease subunit
MTTPDATTPAATSLAANLPDATTRDPHALAGVSAIWLREIRGRMRGKRAFVFLTFYLAVLAALLWIGLGFTRDRPMGALDSVGVGRGIFTAIILIETLVVLILGPAYTGSSISQERERQTFDLLAATPVSSLAIVVGKLLSALSFLAVVVGASIPLASLAFLFGGVGFGDLLLGYLVIGCIAVGAGAVGVAASAIFRKTQPATVAALVAVALTAGGSSLVFVGMSSRAQDENSPPPSEALLIPNPFIAQGDLVCAMIGNGCFVTPSQSRQFAVARPVPANQFAVDQPVPAVPEPPNEARTLPGTIWPKTALVWLIVAIVAILVAAQSISPTRRMHAPSLRPPVRRPAPTPDA